MTSTDVTPPKKQHLWAKGQSGNVAGRPKGSKNAISLIKLQIEGELRAQMKGDMTKVVAEMMRQALPTHPVDKDGNPLLDKDGQPIIIPGDRDMMKTLFKSWVSGTVASDEDAPKERINIVIGKLDQIPEVKGSRTIVNNSSTTGEE